MTVIYEVNLAVDALVADAFSRWLPGHMDEMLAWDGFEHATWYHRDPADEGAVDDGRVLWTVHYRLRDRPALERYFREHADAMRADGLARFGGHFSATRRILSTDR